jgi:hypothetical protein
MISRIRWGIDRRAIRLEPDQAARRGVLRPLGFILLVVLGACIQTAIVSAGRAGSPTVAPPVHPLPCCQALTSTILTYLSFGGQGFTYNVDYIVDLTNPCPGPTRTLYRVWLEDSMEGVNWMGRDKKPWSPQHLPPGTTTLTGRFEDEPLPALCLYYRLHVELVDPARYCDYAFHWPSPVDWACICDLPNR